VELLVLVVLVAVVMAKAVRTPRLAHLEQQIQAVAVAAAVNLALVVPAVTVL
jgi:hypothetical protein